MYVVCWGKLTVYLVDISLMHTALFSCIDGVSEELAVFYWVTTLSTLSLLLSLASLFAKLFLFLHHGVMVFIQLIKKINCLKT